MCCWWGPLRRGSGVVASEYTERFNVGAREEDGVDGDGVSA